MNRRQTAIISEALGCEPSHEELFPNRRYMIDNRVRTAIREDAVSVARDRCIEKSKEVRVTVFDDGDLVGWMLFRDGLLITTDGDTR
jgi:hypothetical protein